MRIGSRKDHFMRWVLCLVLALAFSARLASAQEQPSAEEIKRLGEQLKAAQDRINKLADENEKLVAKNAELQKQVDSANAVFAEKTYQFRATQAAWESFLRRHPALLGRWQAFLKSSLLDAPGTVDWIAVD
jgi:FtsZ-binding cell division protein ZapB